MLVTLNEVNYGDDHGESRGTLSGVVTGRYNTVTETLTMDAGTFQVDYIAPFNSYYTFMIERISNLTTGSMAYSASAYECIETNWTEVNQTSFCGNYNFGANGIKETILDYSTMPGTITLGGDDVDLDGTNEHYILQASYYATQTDFYNGQSLIMRSALWNTTSDPWGGSGNGVELVLSVTGEVSPVPVPAAIWLFGSALIGLVGVKRKQ
ncbi:VPLPA-CTERM sorting domain-containing protein [Oceanicoccus sp. KOV_DT_Chl]|uniref:VPLPA-CTERM sorting domain-containing protein n=1 Tax=Oceanicoccus sp. KOV_DT_Chl TaxID=1904639 RepID=UPI000C7D877E|nr:VPLPA-CTERM sorting domain-containing protein [Oceanicoccus sp. KOV_DT_Chl]